MSVLPQKSLLTDKDRLYRIDTLRFILALCVVCYHLRLTPFFAHIEMPRIMRTVAYLLFNGQAAVVVFFVISGMCIHFPFRYNPEKIVLKNFYFRKFIRIGIPALLLYLISVIFGIYKSLDAVIWSLICELVYYLLYPLLLYGNGSAIHLYGWQNRLASKNRA